MKQATREKYKQHTQLRYKERFKDFYESKKQEKLELSDSDYYRLSEICKKDEDGSSMETLNCRKEKTRQVRKRIVVFDGIHMMCVYHVKTGFIKTLYPFTKKKIKKLTSKK